MHCFALPEVWTLRARGDAPSELLDRLIAAEVPGSIHVALERAGVIPNPHLGDNERIVQWVERADWDYRVAFETPDGWEEARVELVFERIDTVATVVLNGVLLGRAANMHHPHRWDVRQLLRASGQLNELTVHLTSAVTEVWREEQRLGTLPYLNTEHPYNFIRKSAYHFGWDWAPSLVGGGLGPVRLEAWTGTRITAVRPAIIQADEGEAVVDLHIDRDGEGECDVQLRFHGELVAEGRTQAGIVRLRWARPARWWPRGHGEPHLYECEVRTNHQVVHSRLGVRSVALDTDDGAFRLIVNGVPIYCKGANFVPQDTDYERAISTARYDERLQQACDANMNTLRVWGGGFYETDAFYDRCDELGLLVWQDFLFACACYPEEEPHRSRVEAEARHQIARLCHHPSLVLWNGCNENLWGYFDWGWADRTKGRTWGLGYYLELLPRLCRELDPSRPYWPGSPYSGAFNHPDPPHPNAPELGNRHVWDEWQGTEHPVIGNEAPRFVSEFGFQGPPSFPLLQRAFAAPGETPTLQQHQKLDRAERAAAALVEAWFGPGPWPLEREHQLRQTVQARAVGSMIEWLRVCWPRNAGAIVWQLNDAWPAMSWSLIDHDGSKKPVYYAVQRAFADRLLTFQTDSTGLALFLVNDTNARFEGDVTIELRRFDGEVLDGIRTHLVVAARAVGRLDCGLLPSDSSRQLLVGRAKNLFAHRFFLPDKELDLPDISIVGVPWAP